jgi:hypothetical protein
MSIEEKGKRSLANATASIENENQKSHSYCENESAGHLTGEFEHKGEDVQRAEKASKATAGRHIVSGNDGLAIARERKSHNEKSKKEAQKVWDSNRLSVVPERKGRK